MCIHLKYYIQNPSLGNQKFKLNDNNKKQFRLVIFRLSITTSFLLLIFECVHNDFTRKKCWMKTSRTQNVKFYNTKLFHILCYEENLFETCPTENSLRIHPERISFFPFFFGMVWYRKERKISNILQQKMLIITEIYFFFVYKREKRSLTVCWNLDIYLNFFRKEKVSYLNFKLRFVWYLKRYLKFEYIEQFWLNVRDFADEGSLIWVTWSEKFRYKWDFWAFE